MTRAAILLVVAIATLGGCDKPSPDSCRKALHNMQRLLGTDTGQDDAALEGEVRRCRGGSSREAVECASKATNLDELRKCDFYKVPDKPAGSAAPAGSAGPAAAPPAGSAAQGSGAHP